MLREIVRFAVPGCALAAAIWMLARYFAVLRPRAGTTEWIGRLTPPPWQPVSGCPLHGMDAPAALLLCLAVTGLRLLEHWLPFHALPVTPEALSAACTHLLLRRLLGGMLPALSGALFFGLLQDGSPAVTAALLGYVLWRTAKRRGGGWIVLSVVCFAAGLLKERALLLLLPLYPIGYVCTRLSRRTGLGRSLALTLPLSLLGALGVAVLGWWMAGRGTPLEALRSFRFYEALWPALCGALRAAVTLPGRFSPTELALGALAVLTLPELLHGLCCGRDLLCQLLVGRKLLLGVSCSVVGRGRVLGRLVLGSGLDLRRRRELVDRLCERGHWHEGRRRNEREQQREHAFRQRFFGFHIPRLLPFRGPGGQVKSAGCAPAIRPSQRADAATSRRALNTVFQLIRSRTGILFSLLGVTAVRTVPSVIHMDLSLANQTFGEPTARRSFCMLEINGGRLITYQRFVSTTNTSGSRRTTR